MSTEQCRRLLDAYREACGRPTSVLVLGGERDFFSNGIHLNVIEAADDPAAESWANINAIDDLVEAVLTTTDRLVVSALGGQRRGGRGHARPGGRRGVVPRGRRAEPALPPDGPVRLGVLDAHAAAPGGARDGRDGSCATPCR